MFRFQPNSSWKAFFTKDFSNQKQTKEDPDSSSSFHHQLILRSSSFLCFSSFFFPLKKLTYKHINLPTIFLFVHLISLSPLCVWIFLCKLLNFESPWLHWSHCTFSPVCIFRCFLKLPSSANVFLHWPHLYDFSFVCFQMPP